MDEQAARRVAEQLIADAVRPVFGDVVILDDRTLDADGWWVFFYNSPAFVETGSYDHALIGNAPILVSKATGEGRLGRTDLPVHDQIPPQES